MKIPNPFLSIAVAFALLHQAVGCTSYSRIDPKTWNSDKTKDSESVRLVNNKTFDLDKKVPISLRTLTRVVVGTDSDGLRVVLPLDSLAEAVTTKLDQVPFEGGVAPWSRVLTTYDRIVRFSGNGGTYDTVQQLILGTSNSGEPIRLKASLVKSTLAERIVTLTRDELASTRPTLMSVQSVSGISYTFDKKGGSYRDSLHVIAVTLKDGRNLLVPLDEIKNVSKPDGALSVFVIASVFALFGIFVAIMSSLDFEMGGNVDYGGS